MKDINIQLNELQEFFFFFYKRDKHLWYIYLIKCSQLNDNIEL